MSSLSKLLDHNKATLAAVAHIAEVVVANTAFQKDEHRTQAELAVATLHAVADDAAKHDNGATLRSMLAPIVAELVAQSIAPKADAAAASSAPKADAPAAQAST